MIQSTFQTILTSILGQYIEEFDVQDAFQFSLWNGSVDVHQLNLKKDAVNSLLSPSPLRLSSGRVGTFTMQIPWTNFLKQPIRVHIQDIDLDFDLHTEEIQSEVIVDQQERLRVKREKIRSATMKSKNTTHDGKDTSSSSSRPGLFNRLLMKLLDHFQIQIERIHVRIHDRLGIEIDELLIQSADVNWIYTLQVPTSEASCLRKQFELKDIRMYWDIPRIPTASFNSSLVQNDKHDYMLQPANHTIRLMVNDTGESIPLSTEQFRQQIYSRLGIPWFVKTINAITDEYWAVFVAQMPLLDSKSGAYTLSLVFAEAWTEACERCSDEYEGRVSESENDEAIPSLEQFEQALGQMLQWSESQIRTSLRLCVEEYRNAAMHILQEKTTFIDASAEIENLSLHLTQPQYYGILEVMSSVSFYYTKLQYIQYRPAVPLHENPKIWWNYAIQIIIEQNRTTSRRHIDWNDIIKYKKQRVRYIELYLNDQRLAEEQHELDQLEDHLDIETLLVFRRLADHVCSQNKEQQKKTIDGKVEEASYFSYSYWFPGQSSPPGLQDDQQQQESMTQHDLETWYDTLELEKKKSPSDSSIKVRFEMKMHHADLKLFLTKRSTHSESCLISAEMNGLSISFLQRQEPKNAIALDLVIWDMSIHYQQQIAKILLRMPLEKIKTIHSTFPDLPALRLQHCESALPLIKLAIQSPPLVLLDDNDAELYVAVMIQPVQMHIPLSFVLDLLNFFATPQALNLCTIEATVWENAAALTKYSTAQIHHAVSQRTRLHLKLDVTCPSIELIENQKNGTPGGACFQFHLGHIHAQSQLQPQLSPDGDNNQPLHLLITEEQKLYDTIDFRISGLQIFVSNRSSGKFLEVEKGWTTLLQVSSISMILAISIAPQIGIIPRVKWIGSLEKVMLHLSSSNYLCILTFMSTLSALMSTSISTEDSISIGSTDIISNESFTLNQSIKQLAVEYPIQMQQMYERFIEGLSLEDALSLWKRIIFQSQFTLNHLEIKIANDDRNLADDEIITIQLIDLSSGFIQRSYDRSITFDLRALYIQDHIIHHGDEQTHYLISSDSQSVSSTSPNLDHHLRQPLIHIVLQMVSHQIPAVLNGLKKDDTTENIHRDQILKQGSTKEDKGGGDEEHHNTWNSNYEFPISILILFDSLTVNCHRETLASLIQFLMVPIIDSRATEKTEECSELVSSSSISSLSTINKQHGENGNISVSFQCHLCVQYVAIHLLEKQIGSVAFISIEKLNLGYAQSAIGQRLFFQLNSTSIKDSQAKNCYIIQVQEHDDDEEKPMLKFRVQLQKMSLESIYLRAGIARLRFVYRFIQDVWFFLTTGPFIRAVSSLSAPTADDVVYEARNEQASSSQSTSIHNENHEQRQLQFPLIDILIYSGRVEMPETSEISNSLIIYYDLVLIKNFGSTTGITNAKNNLVMIDVNDFGFLTRKKTSLLEKECNLLQKSNAHCEIHFLENAIDTLIHIDDPLRIAFTKEQYDSLFVVPFSNFYEEPKIQPCPTTTTSDERIVNDGSSVTTKYHFDLKISNVSLELLVDEGYTAEIHQCASHQLSFARMNIDRLSIDLYYDDQLTLILEILNSFQLESTSKASGISKTYSNLVNLYHPCSTRDDTEVSSAYRAPVFHVSIIKNSSTPDMDFIFQIPEVKLILTPLLWSWINFMIPRFPQSFAPAADRNEIENQNSDGREDMQRKYNFQLTIPSGSLLLIENPQLIKSRSLVLSWELKWIIQDLLSDLSAFQFQGSILGITASTTANDPMINAKIDNHMHCIQPFGLTFGFSATPETNTQNFLLQTDSTLQVRIGYLDVKTVLGALSFAFHTESPLEEKYDNQHPEQKMPSSTQLKGSIIEAAFVMPQPIMYQKTQVAFFLNASTGANHTESLGYYDNGRGKALHRKYLAFPPLSSQAMRHQFSNQEFTLVNARSSSSRNQNTCKRRGYYYGRPIHYGDELTLCDKDGHIVQKCTQLGIHGYIGPNTSTGEISTNPFIFRIWRAGKQHLGNVKDMDRSIIREGDRVIWEGISLFQNYPSLCRGGFLMFNGYGDAPVEMCIQPTITSTNSSNDHDNTVDSRGGMQPQEQYKSSYRLNIPGLKLTFVNDTASTMHLPLLNVQLQQIEGEIQTVSVNEVSKISALLQFGIEAAYYNANLGAWEPCIEAWTLHLMLNVRGGVLCKSCMYPQARPVHSHEKKECSNLFQPCDLPEAKLSHFYDTIRRVRDTKYHYSKSVLQLTTTAAAAAAAVNHSQNLALDRQDDRPISTFSPNYERLVSQNCTDLFFVSKQPLLVNITPGLVNVVSQVSSIFMQEGSQVNKAKNGDNDLLSSFIYIDNQCGLDLKYYLEKISNEEQKTKEWIIVQHNECHRTILPAHEPPPSSSASRTRLPPKKRIWINLLPFTKHDDACVRISDMGLPFMFILNPSQSKQFQLSERCTLVCTMEAEKGTIILRIRSFATILNQLPFSIRMRYHHISGSSSSIILQSKRLHYIPVQYLLHDASTFDLLLLDDENDSQRKSDAVAIGLNDIFKTTAKSPQYYHHRLLCYQSDASNKMIVLTCEEHQDQQLTQWKMVLQAPVIVENRIPYPISCRMVQSGANQNHTISPNEICHMYHLNEKVLLPKNEQVELMVKWDNQCGESWCPPIDLSSKNVSIPFNNSGTRIRFSTESTRTAKASAHGRSSPTSGEELTPTFPIRCCIYSEFCFIDQTGLNLTYDYLCQSDTSSEIQKIECPSKYSQLQPSIALFSPDLPQLKITCTVAIPHPKIQVTMMLEDKHRRKRRFVSDAFDIGTIGMRGQLLLCPTGDEVEHSDEKIKQDQKQQSSQHKWISDNLFKKKKKVPRNHRQYEIGVKIDLPAQPSFSRTTVVSFLPRYRIFNETCHELLIQQVLPNFYFTNDLQHKMEDDEAVKWDIECRLQISSGQCHAFSWWNSNGKKQIQLSIANTAKATDTTSNEQNQMSSFCTQWSGGFELSYIGELDLPLRRRHFGSEDESEDELHPTSSLVLFHMVMQLNDPMIDIHIREVPLSQQHTAAPFHIVNDSTRYHLKCWQAQSRFPHVTALDPLESCSNYYLDMPLGCQELRIQLWSVPPLTNYGGGSFHNMSPKTDEQLSNFILYSSMTLDLSELLYETQISVEDVPNVAMDNDEQQRFPLRDKQRGIKCWLDIQNNPYSASRRQRIIRLTDEKHISSRSPMLGPEKKSSSMNQAEQLNYQTRRRVLGQWKQLRWNLKHMKKLMRSLPVPLPTPIINNHHTNHQNMYFQILGAYDLEAIIPFEYEIKRPSISCYFLIHLISPQPRQDSKKIICHVNNSSHTWYPKSFTWYGLLSPSFHFKIELFIKNGFQSTCIARLDCRNIIELNQRKQKQPQSEFMLSLPLELINVSKSPIAAQLKLRIVSCDINCNPGTQTKRLELKKLMEQTEILKHRFEQKLGGLDKDSVKVEAEAEIELLSSLEEEEGKQEAEGKEHMEHETEEQEDEKQLMVTLLSVKNLVLSSIPSQVLKKWKKKRNEIQLYASITIQDTTRCTDLSEMMTSNTFSQKNKHITSILEEDYRVQFPINKPLGLDLFYHGGVMIVRSLFNPSFSTCGQERKRIHIGDQLVAINGQQVKGWGKYQIMNTLEAVMEGLRIDLDAFIEDENEEEIKRPSIQGTTNINASTTIINSFELTFLRSFSKDVSSSASNTSTKTTKTAAADWNQSLYFILQEEVPEENVHQDVETLNSISSTMTRNGNSPSCTSPSSFNNLARVRLYVKNKEWEQNWTAEENISMIPFLYFFGQDETLRQMNHLYSPQNYDFCIGEAWVPLPSFDSKSSSSGSSSFQIGNEIKEERVALFSIHPPFALCGELHILLNWKHISPNVPPSPTATPYHYFHHLTSCVQMDLSGVGISMISSHAPQANELLFCSMMGTENKGDNNSQEMKQSSIHFNYTRCSSGQQVFDIQLYQLQIDNQLYDTNFPVLLAPRVVLPSIVKEDESTIDAEREEQYEIMRSNYSPIVFQCMLVTSALPQGMDALPPQPQHQHGYSFDFIYLHLLPLNLKLEDSFLVALVHWYQQIQWHHNGPHHPHACSSINATTLDQNGLIKPPEIDPFILFHLPNLMRTATTASSGTATYLSIHRFLLSSIKIHVTYFTTTDDPLELLNTTMTLLLGGGGDKEPTAVVVPSSSTPIITKLFRTLLGAATAIMTNLDAAPITIPQFYEEHVYESMSVFQSRLMSHFWSWGLRSFYKVIGSVDIIGNPVALVSTLGTGVRDFFYSPVEHLVQHENEYSNYNDGEDGMSFQEFLDHPRSLFKIEDLTTGMTHGSKSLLQNTALGIFHTTEKITQALGKGVSMLAMDDAYSLSRQRRLRQQHQHLSLQQQQRPSSQHHPRRPSGGPPLPPPSNTTAAAAAALDGGNLADDVWEGIQGVVMNPVKEVGRHGLTTGLVTGIGKGFAGLVAKPTAGLLDLFHNLSKGAAAAIHSTSSNVQQYYWNTRTRLPRRICQDGVIVPYSQREAEGMAMMLLLLEAEDDMHCEQYLYHGRIASSSPISEARAGCPSQYYLFLTNERLFSIDNVTGEQQWTMPIRFRTTVTTRSKNEHEPEKPILAMTCTTTNDNLSRQNRKRQVRPRSSSSSTSTVDIQCESGWVARTFQLAIESLVFLQQRHHEGRYGACVDEEMKANSKNTDLYWINTRYLILNLETQREKDMTQVQLPLLLASSTVSSQNMTLERGGPSTLSSVGALPTIEDLRAQSIQSIDMITSSTSSHRVKMIDAWCEYTLYEIQIHGGPYVWTIFRRFSDIAECHAEFVSALGNTDRVGFPQLSLWQLIWTYHGDKTNPALIARRQDQLQHYFRRSLSMSEWCSSSLVMHLLTHDATNIRLVVEPSEQIPQLES